MAERSRFTARARLALSVLAVAPWILAGADAWRFLTWATECVAHSGCRDAHDDLRFARLWATVAVVGAGVAIACSAWWIRRASIAASFLCGANALFGVWLFVGDHARPIVLLPTGLLWLLAWAIYTIVLMPVLLLCAIICRSARSTPERSAP